MGNSHNFCRVSTRFVTLFALRITYEFYGMESGSISSRREREGEERGRTKGGIQLHSDSPLSHRDLNEHAGTWIERSMGSIDDSDRDRCIVPTPVPRSRDSMNNLPSPEAEIGEEEPFFFLFFFLSLPPLFFFFI